MRGIYLAMMGLFATVSLFAQNNGRQVTEQQLVWYAYNNTLELSQKWSLTSEIHERRFRNPDKQHQFQVSSRLNYGLGENWSASAGFIYFLQSPHDPRATDYLVVPNCGHTSNSITGSRSAGSASGIVTEWRSGSSEIRPTANWRMVTRPATASATALGWSTG